MPEGRQEVDSGVFLWLGNVEKDKESRRYGLGFFVARELMASVSSATTISNRIALLRLMLRPVDKNGKGGRHLVFVNCYAPHSWLVKANPQLAEEFYCDLESVVKQLKKEKAIVIVGGDS